MGSRIVLRELAVLELKRVRIPALRSLIPPLLLGVSALLRSEPRHDLLLASIGVGMALAAIAVGLQVGRDRDDGTLLYFASMPIQGEVLAGARFLAALCCCALFGCATLVLGKFAAPAIGMAVTARVIVGMAIPFLVLGWIVIALLSRHSWTAIVTWPVLVMVVGGFLIDLTGIGQAVTARLTYLLSGASVGASLLGLAVLIWTLVILTALGAFVLAISSLQPNGGQPTADAIDELARYHGELPGS